MPALLPSELEIARTKHHWIVLLRPPKLWPGVAGTIVLVLAVIWPMPWLLLLVLLIGAVAFLRWQTWQAELILLTHKRVIHVQGVPETTTSEAFLRIDRVSGARLIQTVPGKVLKYGTIMLEAPGDHPEVKRLTQIPTPEYFYGVLRRLVFGEHGTPDPDEPPPAPDNPSDPGDYLTAPLPQVVDERHWHHR